MIALEDFEGMDEREVWDHVINGWGCPPLDEKRFDIVVAYESVGDYGCDSSGYFLLREKDGGTFYEVEGSHCSCYGFEDQWEPGQTSLGALKMRNYIGAGGYSGIDSKQLLSIVLKAAEDIDGH